MERSAHCGDPPGKAGENKHTQKIGQCRHNGLEAAGIGHARPAHKAAAANDGGAHGSHQHQWTEGPAAQIVVIHALNFLDHHHADQNHGNQVGCDDDEVDCVKLIVNHRLLLSDQGPIPDPVFCSVFRKRSTASFAFFSPTKITISPAYSSA